MSGQVRCSVADGLAWVTLAHAGKFNAMSRTMWRQLKTVFTELQAHTGLRGAVVAGEGGHFCAGGDIRFMHDAALSGDLALDDFFTEEYALDHLIHTYPKPTVAWLEGVCMGALASHDQQRDVGERVRSLLQSCDQLFGASDGFEPRGEGVSEGAFFAPTLLQARDPHADGGAHDIEAFGPVSTLMAYDDLDEALALAARGKGSLVCSLVARDPASAATMRRLRDAARTRLRNWEVSGASVTRKGREARLVISSPANAVVIEKPVVQGDRFEAGQTVLRLADLSTVWVVADVPTSASASLDIGGKPVAPQYNLEFRALDATASPHLAMAVIRHHLAAKGLGLHNDLQNESSIVGTGRRSARTQADLDWQALSPKVRVYRLPGIADTVSIDHIKRGYYSITALNPNGIVPLGPKLDWITP